MNNLFPWNAIKSNWTLRNQKPNFLTAEYKCKTIKIYYLVEITPFPVSRRSRGLCIAAKQPEINSKLSYSLVRMGWKKRREPPPISYAAFWWLPPKFVAAFTAILPPHSCLTSCNVSHLPRWPGLPGCPRASERADGAPDGSELFHKRHVCIDNPLLRSAGPSLPFDCSGFHDRGHFENVYRVRARFFVYSKTFPFFAIYNFLHPFFSFVGTHKDPTREFAIQSFPPRQFPLDLTSSSSRTSLSSVDEHDNRYTDHVLPSSPSFWRRGDLE